MKERIKSVSFWAEIIGAVFLILAAFGVEIADGTASSVVNAACSLLVMFGIVDSPKRAQDRTELGGESDKSDESGEITENAEAIAAVSSLLNFTDDGADK